jgi:hypothetical protein
MELFARTGILERWRANKEAPASAIDSEAENFIQGLGYLADSLSSAAGDFRNAVKSIRAGDWRAARRHLGCGLTEFAVDKTYYDTTLARLAWLQRRAKRQQRRGGK